MIVFTLMALVFSQAPYVRSKVRPGNASDHCLYWAEGQTLTWKANQVGDDETPGTTEFDAFRAAFGEWNDALTACGSLRFSEGPLTPSRKIGWLENASEIANNENILLFRETSCSDVVTNPSDPCFDTDAEETCGNKHDCWEHQSGAIALTTTTYDPQSGRILDADVEFNSAPMGTSLGFLFTTVDSPRCTAPNYETSCVAWDIQNTLTHEIGHMMGLDHTSAPGSTMNPTAPPGELSKRMLDPGTRSFVCNVYPSGQPAKDCVVRSVTGQLGNVAVGCGCGTSAGVLLVPALVWLLRRRRRA